MLLQRPINTIFINVFFYEYLDRVFIFYVYLETIKNKMNNIVLPLTRECRSDHVVDS